MLRHSDTATSLMQALRLGFIDTQSPAGQRLGCIDTQPPQPPEYCHMYSAYTSSDRSINQLTHNPFISPSVVRERVPLTYSTRWWLAPTNFESRGGPDFLNQ
jgi:hypothetical protein